MQLLLQFLFQLLMDLVVCLMMEFPGRWIAKKLGHEDSEFAIGCSGCLFWLVILGIAFTFTFVFWQPWA